MKPTIKAVYWLYYKNAFAALETNPIRVPFWFSETWAKFGYPKFNYQDWNKELAKFMGKMETRTFKKEV